MLTFAAPSNAAQTRGFGLSDGPVHHQPQGWANGQSALLHANHRAQTRYWPCELLDTFILKMAAAGHCVNTAMMLGDRDYAMVKLATAGASHDDELMALSTRLQVYFEADAPEACIVAAAISQEPDPRLLVV